MSGGGQKSVDNKMSISNSMPPLIDFGEDNEIWGFESSTTEQVSAVPSILLQSRTERESSKDIMDYNASISKNGAQQLPCVRKSENFSYDLFSNQTPRIDNSSGFSLYSDVSSSSPSQSTLDLLSSRTHSIHKPTSIYSYDAVSSLPQRPLDLLSDVCISTALLASKPESSVSMPEFGIDDASKPETSAEFGIDDASLHQDDLFGTCSSDSLNSEYTNPFGSPPSARSPVNDLFKISSESQLGFADLDQSWSRIDKMPISQGGHSGFGSWEDSSQSFVDDPFKSSSEFQLGSTDAFLNQSWPGIENVSIAQGNHSDLGSSEENFGNVVSSAGHQGKRSLEHLDYSANQQTGSTLGYKVLPGTDNLKPNSMQQTTECLIEATEVYPHGQKVSNLDLEYSKMPKLVGDIHQETRKTEESGAVSAPILKEFVASGGGKGIFRVPTREAIRSGRPAFLELRPHPLRETQDRQTICTIICTGNRLWAGLESGIRFWDIDKAYGTGRESNPVLGDEDTAPFVSLPLHDTPTTCLVADAARNIVWSGHRDGKIRGWPIDMSSDAVSSKLTWRAHLGPVLSIAVTSYGELWTGSEAGSIRVWPWEDLKVAIFSNLEKHHNTFNCMEGYCIDLRSQLTAIGASILSTDIRFLIYDHSADRIWSAGLSSVVLWDARARDVLKVFGSDAQPEFLNSDLLPGQGVSLDSEMKMNFSKVSRKEKIQGSLTFLQRSKNALLGAADAVRASLGGPFLDDNRKIQAMVASVDGTVWTGYANGSLVHWDHQGNQLQESPNTYVGIHCLCALRTGLWIGYADGRVQIIERSGKVLKGWLAHSSPVHQMAVGSDHVFTLAAHGGIRGWNVAILSPFEGVLRSKLIDMEPAYTRKEHIKILAGTWNVSQGRASFDSLRCWLASPASEANIVVIGLQEIEMGAGVLAIAAAKETVGIEGSANGQWWLDSIGDAIDENLFLRVGSRQLAGLLIGAWVRKDLSPYVGDVDVGAVACGFGRALGNKGAVAIKMRVFRRTMCIVNSHFAAHMDAIARRNADFDYIYRSMTFGRFPSGVNVAANAVTAGVSSAVQMLRGVNARRSSQSLEMGGQFEGRFSSLSTAESLPQEVMPELAQADMIIWLGDFNYRLNGVSYEDAIDHIKQKKFATLLENDQLRKEMGAGRVFQGMREGEIYFSPTYKFDRGQQTYDSSEKRRVPAWCDRILFRDGQSGTSTKCKLSCPIVSSIEWYNASMDITDSDHKPVMCMFNIDIAFIDEATRREKYGYLVCTSKTEL
ncbi:type II inositol polyphosphate 5-phosphatase 15 isoform X1 [Cryptomeria japonica]|uniref:type II inositol polyphosphate 5-phosphatase 15 isoform X1 n=1 Tax=Cryptomeria japonica TaxID=3369 RepID=UPI0027DA0B70|nr:type II inositol polyphosphate 5-phosphatase 15 isoform X1 [Cryptomeria japonica]